MTCLTTPYHSLMIFPDSSRSQCIGDHPNFPSGFRDRCQEKRRWSYHCRWNRWRHVIWRYKDNLPVAAKIWRESTPPHIPPFSGKPENHWLKKYLWEGRICWFSGGVYGILKLKGCSSYFPWSCWSFVLGLEICRRRPFLIFGFQVG